MMNLARVAALLTDNVATAGGLGASLSVWHEGREVLSLASGYRDKQRTITWTADSPVLIWSATKGPAAACVLHVCQEHQVPLTTPVMELWPEFGMAGKAALTIAEVLSHRAGLAALARPVSVFNHSAVIEALAESAPLWKPTEGHGYHPRTIGFLMDEIVRRVSGGITLADYWKQIFAQPLNLDLWIGLDADRASEVATVFPPKAAPSATDPFYSALVTAGSLTARAFASPQGLHTISSMNVKEMRMMSFPAFGGIGTASSLAKFYCVLAEGGTMSGRTFLTSESMKSMTTTLSQGMDRVLQMETAFSAGFMRDPVQADGSKLRSIFGPSLSAFGHPGAGGSIGFADPENRIAFGYVINQMEPGVLPNSKTTRLVDALYS